MSQYFNHIEIELTSVCDMSCEFCDRYITHAPDKNISLYQIQKFIKESLDLNYPWGRIHVLGGEPTLHPQFREIMQELINYKNRVKLWKLRVITNNQGKLKLYKNWLLQNDVDVYSDYKQPDKVPYFFDNSLRCAKDTSDKPQDVCSIFGIRGCGIGMTRYGYFLCGSGASIARICAYDIGAKSLKDVTFDNMQKQAGLLCNKCGHKEGYMVKVSDDSSHGPFWENLLKTYKERKPELSLLYG